MLMTYSDGNFMAAVGFGEGEREPEISRPDKDSAMSLNTVSSRFNALIHNIVVILNVH